MVLLLKNENKHFIFYCLNASSFKENGLHFNIKKPLLKTIKDKVVCWPQQATIPVMAAIPNGSQTVTYLLNIHDTGRFATH